jgi:hypothetical protein
LERLSVGALWEALKKELHNPLDLERPIEDWSEARFQNMFLCFGWV